MVADVAGALFSLNNAEVQEGAGALTITAFNPGTAYLKVKTRDPHFKVEMPRKILFSNVDLDDHEVGTIANGIAAGGTLDYQWRNYYRPKILFDMFVTAFTYPEYANGVKRYLPIDQVTLSVGGNEYLG